MSVKAILILCAQVLLVKSTLSQCTSRAAVADISGPYGMVAPYGLAAPCGCAAPALAAPCGLAASAWPYDGIYGPGIEFSPTSGGGLPVSSASAIAPVGISVVSDNAYEGRLDVIGELPFVGTVALEGVLPTAGAGAVNHACGNGINAMASGPHAYGSAAYAPAATLAPLGAYGPAGLIAPGLGLHGGWAGIGCGCH